MLLLPAGTDPDGTNAGAHVDGSADVLMIDLNTSLDDGNGVHMVVVDTCSFLSSFFAFFLHSVAARGEITLFSSDRQWRFDPCCEKLRASFEEEPCGVVMALSGISSSLDWVWTAVEFIVPMCMLVF